MKKQHGTMQCPPSMHKTEEQAHTAVAHNHKHARNAYRLDIAAELGGYFNARKEGRTVGQRLHERRRSKHCGFVVILFIIVVRYRRETVQYLD